ncbi:putative UPF0481 protein At3g02645 [Cynara cardunculus var. scolymus]|uniref:Uncharacterized protein n=1 Tax=Cynara cardunculus var. scolymus TaxID=59895 RepID=A0A103YCU0_CYNCS|nr:putative UPF0481 protein At3g02645 [Cynara cardunculus var. scolymus]KVI06726.1 hypothetical protein Ccrd_014919 [Cynara cardunculus var. scolymus]
MGRNLTTICKWSFQNSTRRAAHTEAESRAIASLLEEKLNAELPQTNNGASIYRVPHRLRSVEPKAYEPSIVSIGPYHHGAAHLQAMENTKLIFFHRLFNPNQPNQPNLRALVSELKEMEHKARGCYSEDLKLSSKQFIDMLLIDSCFVIQLLRETREVDYSNKSILIKRWMLPVLQRDLIMLENQLPLFVLNKLYDLTTTCRATKDLGLKDLMLQFFEPMIYKDLGTPRNSALREGDGRNHFLELFRASICPTEVLEKEICGKEPHMFRSITELRKSGIKLKKAEKCQPLDVSFEIRRGVLKIAPLSMDDHKFTLFRNMVAFEQCHFACKPHVTAYIFFLDRLINSAEDIELLHHSGIMQHSLGGNKHAARLVNMLCKEVAGAVDDSYLHNVLWKINCYCNNGWHQKKAKLKHDYFYNIWVSFSTIAAIVLVYLTILQTIWGLGDEDARDHMFGNGFWRSFGEAFLIPFRGVGPSKKSSLQIQIDEEQAIDEKGNQIDEYLQWFFHSNISDDIKPFFFMSC